MTQALYPEVWRDLPVVANIDFGHTSPQMVMPIGCQALIEHLQASCGLGTNITQERLCRTTPTYHVNNEVAKV